MSKGNTMPDISDSISDGQRQLEGAIADVETLLSNAQSQLTTLQAIRDHFDRIDDQATELASRAEESEANYTGTSEEKEELTAFNTDLLEALTTLAAIAHRSAPLETERVLNELRRTSSPYWEHRVGLFSAQLRIGAQINSRQAMLSIVARVEAS